MSERFSPHYKVEVWPRIEALICRTSLSSGGLPAFLFLHVSFRLPSGVGVYWKPELRSQEKEIRKKGYSSRVTLSSCRANYSRARSSAAPRRRGIDSVVTLFKEGLIAEGQDLRGFCEEAWGRYCTVIRSLVDLFLVSFALTTDESATMLPLVTWVVGS